MKSNYTSIAVVLDRSGSMASVKTSTINGFNEFLTTQQGGTGMADLALYTFGTKVSKSFGPTPVSEVKPLTAESYEPSGWTALLDAMGTAITELGERFNAMREEDRPSKVIVLVVTDGAENMSKKFTSPQIQEMVKHQTEKYNWEFSFLGANQDAIFAANTLGILASNAANYVSSAAGTASAFNVMGSSVNRARSGGVLAYSDAERKLVESGGNTGGVEATPAPVIINVNGTTNGNS